MHLPVDQLAAALRLPAAEFSARHHFARPAAGDVVVVHCRTGRRAAWGAQVALDAGLDRVLVYRAGAYGWRLDAAVKPYKAYDPWDVPPEAEAFQLEEAAPEAAGAAELAALFPGGGAGGGA